MPVNPVNTNKQNASNPLTTGTSSKTNTSGGGYGYGGGGSSGPTDNDKKAFDYLGGISGYNFQTPKLVADLSDKAMDIADKGNENLKDLSIKNAKRKASSEWYKSQQDLQSVVSQLADASGNLANGSGFYDFLDLIARRDDQQDVEVLNAAHDNENSIWQDYWEAIQANINSRNNTYIDAQEAMRNVAADYVAQGNNIHPDLVKDLINIEGHSLNIPDWLNSDNFADNRFKQAVNPQMQDFFRPAMDAEKANDKIDRKQYTVNQPAANSNYWQRMRAGYGRRNE